MTWDWKLLDAGRFKLDGGSMFGVVPKGLWSRFHSPDEQNCLPYCCNCILLENDNRRILIESGFGDGWIFLMWCAYPSSPEVEYLVLITDLKK